VGENDFTRPDPRYDAANCLLYTGWNQGGLRILELTNPEYNPCMRREVKADGFLATSRGRGNDKIQLEVHAKRQRDGIKGQLQLRDHAADVRIRVHDLTFLGSVRDECGSVLPTVNSVQVEGKGTFNGAPATFVRAGQRQRQASCGGRISRCLHGGLHLQCRRRAEPRPHRGAPAARLTGFTTEQPHTLAAHA
jgi:hypothetical protein